MAEIEKWITINGAHIPIIKGESRAKAVSNFIKGKQKARKSEIRKKLKGALRDPNSPKGKELLKNTANSIMRDKNPTIKGRAKTRDEIEDERFDKYDEYAHNAARNIRFDNRAKPLSQDELYDRAHAVAQASSMYDMDYKYGRGGTHENKQVRIGDNIESSRYKLKINKGKGSRQKALDDYNKAFRKMEKANEKWAIAEERYKKYGNGDKNSEYYKKMQDAKANYKKSTKILDEYSEKYSETFKKRK